MSRMCMVVGCGNGDYQLSRWKKRQCEIHHCRHDHRPGGCDCGIQPCVIPTCSCDPPFQLFSFPSKRPKDKEARDRWIRAVNREDPKKKGSLLEPNKDQRICSKHFVEHHPTEAYPYPELEMGYTKPQTKKRRVIKKILPVTSTIQLDDAMDTSPVQSESDETVEKDLFSNMTHYAFVLLGLLFHFILTTITLNLFNTYLYNLFVNCKKQLDSVKKKFKSFKVKANSPYQQILNAHQESERSDEEKALKLDADILFYTGIENHEAFKRLYNYIYPYVNRRWRGNKVYGSKVKRLFKKSPQKFGPERKLCGEDEFLLTLMKLRLGLLYHDLAARFHISHTLSQQIFHAWLTAMNKTIGKTVYWPSKDVIINTKPARYRHLPDLRVIIDCSEIFIETPKDQNLQSATWSDYKHHNTLKFLVGVAPNSTITFISDPYLGRCSDKAITNDCQILDDCDPYDMLQADKGFNITNECNARLLTLHIPPGRRGTAQMNTSSVNKTKRIANLRILVEQVIRRLKTFRILQHEMPLTLVPHAHKIVRVCAALSNFRKPIYTT